MTLWNILQQILLSLLITFKTRCRKVKKVNEELSNALPFLI